MSLLVLASESTNAHWNTPSPPGLLCPLCWASLSPKLLKVQKPVRCGTSCKTLPTLTTVHVLRFIKSYVSTRKRKATTQLIQWKHVITIYTIIIYYNQLHTRLCGLLACQLIVIYISFHKCAEPIQQKHAKATNCSCWQVAIAQCGCSGSVFCNVAFA